jgi:hypothetical protein
MTRLGDTELNQAVANALGAAVARLRDIKAPVLELELVRPYPRRLRVYRYNATNPPGGRSTTAPEHKIQLAVPGQVKGQRANFNYSGGRAVLLIGKVEDTDAFVLWDASIYRNFPHSRTFK